MVRKHIDDYAMPDSLNLVDSKRFFLRDAAGLVHILQINSPATPGLGVFLGFLSVSAGIPLTDFKWIRLGALARAC
jgi:hypothetical protein